MIIPSRKEESPFYEEYGFTKVENNELLTTTFLHKLISNKQKCDIL